ncbi:MAG: AMP-binding protein [Leptospiraceae bacterium]|nr:AMP-binding protein [Leptospiraceae bacterium]MBP9162934.1 AMP-binding protein [Leptospiraceae bacterium]
MANNLAELYREVAEKYGSLPAFFSKDEKKQYQSTNYKDLYEMGLGLSEALIELGVKARDKVGFIADHRLEWVIVDAGILMTGAADVPRGTDVTESELEYILNHSEAKVLFVENDKVLEKFNKVKSKTSVKTVIMIDPKATGAAGVLKLYELIEKGKKLRISGTKKVEERIADIKPDDLFTLIYTSGTTGAPKGVMLMHSNMMHQVNDMVPLLEISSKDRVLSILPVWHIFERVFMYAAVSRGASTYFTNVRDMREDFAKAKPTFMGSAPRLWESIYLGVYNRLNDPKQTPAARKAIFNTAYFFSKHFHASVRFLQGHEVDYEGRNPIVSLLTGIKSILVAILTFIPYKLFDAIALSKIRLATGGHLRATCSGGGALQRHVDAFFNDIGIKVIEGYGMTETAPVISARNFKNLVMGSVGKVAPKTELQIRDFNGAVLTHVKVDGSVEGKRGVKGIVFVRGPQVMKGYYKNQEATDKALKDGWMDTGDLGMINFKDTLTLTGRAKDTVVLLGGENVEPVPIENKLTESLYINQIMVVGQDQKNLGAIIVPDFEKLKIWTKENGIAETDEKAIIANSKVLDLYKKEIKELNGAKNGFKSFEQVNSFFLITKPFEVGDEMTNLFKLKRHVITEKYKEQIKKLYL